MIPLNLNRFAQLKLTPNAQQRFPMDLAPDVHPTIVAASKLADAIDAAKKAPLSLWERASVWALDHLLANATGSDDVKDLIQAVDGIVGFAKRRFADKSSARVALEVADRFLDEAHHQLGESAS